MKHIMLPLSPSRSMGSLSTSSLPAKTSSAFHPKTVRFYGRRLEWEGRRSFQPPLSRGTMSMSPPATMSALIFFMSPPVTVGFPWKRFMQKEKWPISTEVS